MASVGLEQLMHPRLVAALPGQPEAEILGQMEVPHRQRIRVTVRALPNLGRRPRPHTRQCPQHPISFAAGDTGRRLDGTRGRRNRADRPDSVRGDPGTVEVSIRHMAPR